MTNPVRSMQKAEGGHVALLRGRAAYRLPPTVPSGFTLIETLVAVTIIAVAIAGPLLSAARAMNAAAIAGEQLTASYLAQEGIEYVRLMRDDAYLATRSSDSAWTTFLTGSAAESVAQCRTSACTLDPTKSMGVGASYALDPCSGNSCAPLYLLSNGVYTEQTGSGTLTPYHRTIQVENIPGTTDGSVPYPEKRVISTVWWTFRGTPYTITVADNLTSWQ